MAASAKVRSANKIEIMELDSERQHVSMPRQNPMCAGDNTRQEDEQKVIHTSHPAYSRGSGRSVREIRCSRRNSCEQS